MSDKPINLIKIQPKVLEYFKPSAASHEIFLNGEKLNMVTDINISGKAGGVMEVTLTLLAAVEANVFGELTTNQVTLTPSTKEDQ